MRLSKCSALLLFLSWRGLALAASGDPYLDACNRAWALSLSGSVAAGRALWQEQIAAHPERPWAWRLLARSYLDDLDWEDGRKYFASQHRYPLCELGLALTRFEDPDPAPVVAHLARCIERTGGAGVCLAGLARFIWFREPEVVKIAGSVPLPRDSPWSSLVRTALAFRANRSAEARRHLEEARARAAARETAAGLDPEFWVVLADQQSYLEPQNDVARSDPGLRAIQAWRDWGQAEGLWSNWCAGLGMLAQLHVYRGEFEAMESALAEVEERAREWQCLACRAEVFHTRAMGLKQRGDLENAVRAMSQAIELERIGRPVLASLWCAELATYYLTLGDLARAHAAADDGRRILDSVPGGRRDGVRMHLDRTLGNLYAREGDWYRALLAQSESVRQFRLMGRVPQAAAGVGNTARYYSALGDLESARRAAGECLAAGRRFHDISEESRCLMILADLELKEGRARAAITYLEMSLQLAARIPERRFEANAWTTLAEARQKLGQPGPALEAATRGLAILERAGVVPDQASAHVLLGNLRVETGALDPAERHYRRAIELAEPGHLAPVLVAAHSGLAEVLRRRGQLPAAAAMAEQALRTLERQRAGIARPELRGGFLGENWRVYQTALRIRAELATPAAAFGAPIAGEGRREAHELAALEIAERAKARVFLDVLGAAGLPTSQPTAGSDERESRQRVVRPNDGFSLEPWSAERIAALARDRGLTIVEFALSESASLAWWIDAQGIRMVRLPGRARIEAAVADLRHRLTHAPGGKASLAEYRAAARRVGRMLLGGWGDSASVGATRPPLVVVPDGVLHYLPFEALVVGSQYLVETAPVSYAPSASVLGELAAMGDRPHAWTKDLLAYGDPRLGSSGGGGGGSGVDGSSDALAERVRAGLFRGAGFRLEPLPGTREEVRRIAGLYPAGRRTVRLGAEATEESVKSAPLEQYRQLHFASHAIVDERRPERSGLVLAGPAARAGEDGVLRVSEILRLRMDAELATLSACQTGLGKVTRGEGMVGLTRAFLQAGARRVAVSLWPVNDLATAELMQRFYRGMKSGAGVADALRGAQVQVLRSGGVWRHPYYWAGFVVVGLW